MATPLVSYRVTLNVRKTRDFIRELIIWQSYKLGPLREMLGFVDKVLARFNCVNFNSHISWRKNFVMFVLPLVRHVFFWVIIILHCRLHWGLVRLKESFKTCPMWFMLLYLIFPTMYKPMRIHGNNATRYGNTRK